MLNTKRGTAILKKIGLAAVGMLIVSSAVRAESHAAITSNRSGSTTYVYFEESVDAEYAHYRLTPKDGVGSTETWQGSVLTTSLGTEIWKFLELEAGYGAVNLHKSSDQLDRMTGSRLHAGLRLDFNAPLFNLELGGGVQASSLDYANHEETATFYGTGNYVSIGLNYFLMTHLSVYAEAKYTSEHMKNTGGSGLLDAVDANSTLGGLGFRIWF